MYVLQNWTFTPGAESAGTIELPGVYTIEQFAHITNLTRNIPLFDAESYEATITLVDDGLTTTLTLRQNTSFCVGLSINGYSDWYLPARYELDIAYQNLKPTTASNDISSGINPYSVPARPANRTAGEPAQTSLTAFQSGGAQAFFTNFHWSSTQVSTLPGRIMIQFTDGNSSPNSPTGSLPVRAFRKVAL